MRLRRRSVATDVNRCETVRRPSLETHQKQPVLYFYRLIYISVLLHRSEALDDTKDDNEKHGDGPMRFLRTVAGYKKTDNERNEELENNWE